MQMIAVYDKVRNFEKQIICSIFKISTVRITQKTSVKVEILDLLNFSIERARLYISLKRIHFRQHEVRTERFVNNMSSRITFSETVKVLELRALSLREMEHINSLFLTHNNT